MNFDSPIVAQMYSETLWTRRTFYNHLSSPEFQRLPITWGNKLVVFLNVTHHPDDEFMLITHIATHFVYTPYIDPHEGVICFKLHYDDDFSHLKVTPLFERVSDLHFNVLNDRRELGFNRDSYSVRYYKGTGTRFSVSFCHKVIEQGLALENYPHSAC